MRLRTLLINAAVALPLALGSGALMAQQQEAPSFNEEELQQFAAAWDDVMEIREDYTEQMQQADEQSDAQELQQAANEEMIDAVEASGLDLETYGEIAQAASNDPELANRINEYRN